MCDEPYVSPYLRRPVRSYDEILRDQAGKAGPRPNDRETPASPRGMDPAPSPKTPVRDDCPKRA